VQVDKSWSVDRGENLKLVSADNNHLWIGCERVMPCLLYPQTWRNSGFSDPQHQPSPDLNSNQTQTFI